MNWGPLQDWISERRVVLGWRLCASLVGFILAACLLPATVVAQADPPPTFPPYLQKQQPRHVKVVGPTSGIADVQGDEPDIIGGEIAAAGAWPWQAALVRPGSDNAYYGHYCGGTLVAPSWVLTAAHCVYGLPSAPNVVDVVLGRTRLSAGGGERIAVDLIIIHPDYDTLRRDSDLALLRLAAPSTQQPISLFAPEDRQLEADGAMATVTGWGRFMPELALGSDELRQVALPLVPREQCAAEGAWGDMITDQMICAGFDEGDRSACYGDSGGPLMVPIDEEPGWAQVGVVSWGSSTCSGYLLYNVYTRVSGFREWIRACEEDSMALACRGVGFVGDDYEPDGDIDISRSVMPGKPGEFHNAHRPQDNDWFRFTAEAGVRYVLLTEELGQRSDTVMWLYDQDQLTVLGYNDDRPWFQPPDEASRYDDRASIIVWQAPHDGVYYVLVHPLYTHAYGHHTDYRFRITEMTPRVFLPLAPNWQ